MRHALVPEAPPLARGAGDLALRKLNRQPSGVPFSGLIAPQQNSPPVLYRDAENRHISDCLRPGPFLGPGTAVYNKWKNKVTFL